MFVRPLAGTRSPKRNKSNNMSATQIKETISISYLFCIFVASEILSREFIVGSFAVMEPVKRRQFLNAVEWIDAQLSPADQELLNELIRIDIHRAEQNK